MPYCTKCGKSCDENVKFCTNCGNPVAKPAPVVIEKPAQPEHRPQAVPVTPEPMPGKKNNKAIWWISGIIIAAGLGTGAYFMFFDKKPAEVSSNDQLLENANQTVADTTTVVQVQPVTNPTDNVGIPPVNRTLARGGGAITEKETQDISGILKLFFEADNNESISVILDYFAYPVKRYYNTKEVSYEKLNGMFENAFNAQLLHHTISVNWEGSIVNKTALGYTIEINATYQFATQKSPEEERSRNFNVFIQMNNDKKITSIYENP